MPSRSGDSSAARLRGYEAAIDASEVRRELYPVRNVHQSFGYGLVAGMAYSGLSLLTGGWWVRDPMPAHAGYERMQTLAAYYRDGRPDPDAVQNPARIDRQLTFDRLTNVHYSGTRHAEDQPSHLHRARRRDLPDALPRGVRQPVHPVLPGQRLRDGRRRRRQPAAADQRLELRPLQDVRHHGPVSDHRLGPARRRRRTGLRRHVGGGCRTSSPRSSCAEGQGDRGGRVSVRRGARAHADDGGSRARAPLRRSDRAPAGQPIMAIWHGRIFGGCTTSAAAGSSSSPARISTASGLRGLLTRFGFGTARGSTSRGAARALVQMRRELASGNPVGFTVDGPRGPARVAQPGAVWLAGATGHPVLPLHVEASRAWKASAGIATADPKADGDGQCRRGRADVRRRILTPR